MTEYFENTRVSEETKVIADMAYRMGQATGAIEVQEVASKNSLKLYLGGITIGLVAGVLCSDTYKDCATAIVDCVCETADGVKDWFKEKTKKFKREEY